MTIGLSRFAFFPPTPTTQLRPWFAQFPSKPKSWKKGAPLPYGATQWMNGRERAGYLRFAEVQYMGELVMWQAQWADWLTTGRTIEKGRLLREKAVEFVERVSAFMPRAFERRHWAHEEGYCYLKMFEPAFWAALRMLLGANPNNRLLALLSPLWRENMNGLEIYRTSGHYAHCSWSQKPAPARFRAVPDPSYPHFGVLEVEVPPKRPRYLSARDTFMMRLFRLGEALVGATRPPSKGKGKAPGKGKGREPPKLKTLSDSVLLVRTIKRQNERRIADAIEETSAQREVDRLEWIDKVATAELNELAANDALEAFEEDLEEKIAKKFPGDKIVSASKAKEACLNLVRGFCSEWIRIEGRKKAAQDWRKAVDDMFDWTAQQGSMTVSNEARNSLKDWLRFTYTDEEWTAIWTECLEEDNKLEAGLRKQKGFWRDIIDGVLDIERSQRYKGRQINWVWEDDVRDGQEFIWCAKVYARDHPEMSKLQIVKEMLADNDPKADQVSHLVIDWSVEELAEIYDKVADMEHWEDIAELMCVHPVRPKEPKKAKVDVGASGLAKALAALKSSGKEINLAEQSHEKVALSFAQTIRKPAADTSSPLTWYTKTRMTEFGYSHFFEDPQGPLKTWTTEAAQAMYEAEGYHFMIQRVTNRVSKNS